MALILCMETATERCSIAVAKDGIALAETHSSADFDHSAQLTLLIEACLSQCKYKLSDLDAIAVSIGPGSYTSLRVGLSTAKGLCYGLDLPLLPIDSLSIIAAGAIQEQQRTAETLYVPMIDARRMEVYSAVYHASGEVLEKPKALILTADAFSDYLNQGFAMVFAGNGAPKFSPLLTSALAHFSAVGSEAVHMSLLAEKLFQQQAFADIAYLEPFYLKPPNITIPKKMNLGAWFFY